MPFFFLSSLSLSLSFFLCSFLIEDLESDVAQLMTTLQTSEEFREWSDAIEVSYDVIIASS